jgi:Na+-driven multidrug efflux pump
MMLRNFGTWVTWGFAEATMAMVGQNIGAGQRERAARVGFAAARVAAAYLLPLGLVVGVGAPWLLSWMLNEPDAARHAEVIALGAAFLRTQIVALPFLGVGMSLEGALRGTGDTVSPLAINLLSLYVVGLPLAAVLATTRLGVAGSTVPGLGWGADGVWLGMAAGVVVRGCLGYARWRGWFRGTMPARSG